MNYLKTILFIILIVIYYYILGSAINKLLKSERYRFENKLVYGYIFTFFIGFVIGLPAQVFSTSWLFFTIIYGITLSVFLFISVRYLKYDKNFTIADIKIFASSNFKNYWFVYLLVITFSIFSMINTQPYFFNNYHDDYYIAKVVHLAGSPHLLNEQYSYGSLLKSTSIFGFAKQQGYRFLNTYELVYSALGSYFFIDLTFFCRCTMVIHNYLMCFLIYKQLASHFINDDFSQYTMLPFVLLLIPSGFAARGVYPLKIRMFENWRFQTAIFYGGSVTRVFALPLFLDIFFQNINKVKKSSLLIFGVIFFTMMSFQTNAICYLLLVLPIYFLGASLYKINSRYTGNDRKNGVIITVLISIIIIVIFDSMVRMLPIETNRITTLIKGYLNYYNNVFIFDGIALFSLIPCVMIYFLVKDRNIRIYTFLVYYLYLIFRLGHANSFLALISYSFYSMARLLTSTLLIMLLMFGIFIAILLKKLKINIYFKNIGYFIILTSLVLSLITNNKKLAKYNLQEENMTSIGYSLIPIESNDKMLPQMIVDVGTYFNKLPYGNYKVLSELSIPYKNISIDNQSLLLSSNRIEIPYQKTLDEYNTNYQLIQKFFLSELDYSKVSGIINNTGIEYIFTPRVNIKNILVGYNYKVVMVGKDHNYWLLRNEAVYKYLKERKLR